MGFEFQKDSPYVQLFRARIDTLNEHGVFSRMESAVTEKKNQFSQYSKDLSVEHEEIGFIIIHSSFYILLSGVIVAIIILIIEILVK